MEQLRQVGDRPYLTQTLDVHSGMEVHHAQKSFASLFQRLLRLPQEHAGRFIEAFQLLQICSGLVQSTS